jgi:hypothetical protein
MVIESYSYQYFIKIQFSPSSYGSRGEILSLLSGRFNSEPQLNSVTIDNYFF